MSDFAAAKVVGSLPATLTPNTLYCVRVGVGFDVYLSDSTGGVAHKVNAPTLEAFALQSKKLELLSEHGCINYDVHFEHPDLWLDGSHGGKGVFAQVGGKTVLTTPAGGGTGTDTADTFHLRPDRTYRITFEVWQTAGADGRYYIRMKDAAGWLFLWETKEATTTPTKQSFDFSVPRDALYFLRIILNYGATAGQQMMSSIRLQDVTETAAIEARLTALGG